MVEVGFLWPVPDDRVGSALGLLSLPLLLLIIDPLCIIVAVFSSSLAIDTHLDLPASNKKGLAAFSIPRTPGQKPFAEGAIIPFRSGQLS